jgi:mitogen-activated protein kinase kinase kinase
MYVSKGMGSFGEVFKAMNDKGKLFAVKRLNMVGKLNEVDDLTKEIELMKDLEHPNIVAYIGACVNEDIGLVYIFQEWAPGGSVVCIYINICTSIHICISIHIYLIVYIYMYGCLCV